jgi:hypothetical protein
MTKVNSYAESPLMMKLAIFTRSACSTQHVSLRALRANFRVSIDDAHSAPHRDKREAVFA